uniref:Uncharacterized protein n=1 Tax=Ditylenchus dipsaci TaxID=166011 RepID=A0A915CZD4_9BILA
MPARKGWEDIEMELSQAISEEFKKEAIMLCRALKQVNHCRQPGLKWMISFLIGSVRVPSQSMSSAEVQLYGSGKHRTEIWWKTLCKSLRDLGSFVCYCKCQQTDTNGYRKDDDDVTVIESERAFLYSSSEMASRSNVYGNVLRKDFDRLAPSHKNQLIKMLSPFGDYEIYLLHAFYHMSIAMLVRRKK